MPTNDNGKNKHVAQNLEQEIEEAAEEGKGHVEESQKIAISTGDISQPASQVPETPVQKYDEEKSKYSDDKPQSGYIENQEFYIKHEGDIPKVKDTVREIKAENPGMSSVDDSDLYELEPETKKLKIRKMPRNVLDRLKEKQVILEYYKII